MDLRSGLPYFWIQNGLPFEYPTLRADVRCQVLVVGGGITGALCAHACASADLDVVVIDGRSIGTGSTSASTALLQYEIDTPLHALSDAVGAQSAVRSYRLCIEAVEELIALARALAVPVAARQSLQFASKRGHVKDLRKEQTMRAEQGFDVDFLEADAVRQQFGFRKPAALLSHLAAEIDPYVFTHALFQEVIARGGQVFDRTCMEHSERTGSGFRVRTAKGQMIEADHLIMATGYESQRHLPRSIMDLHSTYAVASERIDAEDLWYQDCLIWETAHPYLYLRTTPDRRIIIGGLDEPYRDPKRRDALLDRKTRGLVKKFKELFPHLPFEPEYQWCGTFGSTKDGLPFIDRDEGTGAWFVLGMGGNGITFSQVGAHIVRDAILGEPSADRALFRFDR